MKFINVFNTVEKEYSKEVAVLVVTALSLNISMNVKRKDLIEAGNFTNRLNRKTRSLLWEIDDDMFKLVVKIRDSWNEYENRISMEGLGGCKVKSLRDIVKSIKEI